MDTNLEGTLFSQYTCPRSMLQMMLGGCQHLLHLPQSSESAMHPTASGSPCFSVTWLCPHSKQEIGSPRSSPYPRRKGATGQRPRPLFFSGTLLFQGPHQDHGMWPPFGFPLCPVSLLRSLPSWRFQINFLQSNPGLGLCFWGNPN